MVPLFIHCKKHAILAVYMNFYAHINRFYVYSEYFSIYE